MLNCTIILENGEEVEAEKGNRLIKNIIGCLVGQDMTVMYARFILSEVMKEIERQAHI